MAELGQSGTYGGAPGTGPGPLGTGPVAGPSGPPARPRAESAAHGGGGGPAEVWRYRAIPGRSGVTSW